MGGWVNRGNVLRYNSWANIRNLVPLTTPSGDTAPIEAVYLDDQMSGWAVYGNEFRNCEGAMLIGGGRRNELRRNYCEDVDWCVHIDNRGMQWQTQPCTPPNGDLWKGLYAVDYQQPPWATAYPEMTDIADEQPCDPYADVVSGNEWCRGQLA